jgi:hypothetical protein
MCAPLWNKEQIIGIIHVDSPMLTNCFTLTDLDLLTALGHNAAVAIERARLNQKIVAEEKKRERLGRFLSPQVTNRILNSSESQGAEQMSLYPDHLIISCTTPAGEVELAMSSASLMGFQSWLEAGPPGTDWDSSRPPR